MGVPSNVVERINGLEIARKHIDQRKRRDPADQLRRQTVDADRKARRPLLMELALDVFAWRDGFVKSPDGRRLWELIGRGTRVIIYADWFWDGLPIEPGNAVNAQTRVFLDGPNHQFLFEEWRNGCGGGAFEPWQETFRASSPLDLVDKAHPKMLEGLQTRLSGPEAWQPVIDELERRLSRYMTAP